ncbi:MAG: thiamine pyrophosphate-binding protein [Armatimonadetes bacterium]|nr:thiamine pyrophosphate-binding protein [Armatimonadota bacterium]
MNGADLLVKELQARGTPCLYTLCGNGLDAIFDATHRANLRVIDTRNEQAAAYMADTAGRLTRRLGVVAVSTGVAHINALTGVCNAWFDGSPMLLITGASDSATAGRGNFQDMDSVGLARPLCKYSAGVDRPERLGWLLDEAIRAAVSGRPGPVHLTIPMDVLRAPAPEAGPQGPRTAEVVYGGEADETSLAEAVKLIGAAERPFIIAGSGCFYADASAELAVVAEQMRAPVAVPIWDRGAIEQPIPEFVGVIGAASGQPRVMPDADLILLLGAEVDYRVGYLEPPAIAPGARIIRCDVEPEKINQGVRPDLPLLGDPRQILRQLSAALDAEGRRGNAEWLTEAQLRNADFRRPWTAMPPPASPACTGRHVIEAIRQAVPEDAFILVDGGNIGQWFHMSMCDRYPARWLTCGRSAVVGWGFPGAAAVRSLYADEPVLLLSGDGSATFTLAEIEAAARQNLPYVAIVADDSAWGIVVSGCRKREQPPVACALGPIDFVAVAEGFGARGIRVEDASRLPAAIDEGFASGQVTLIHVPVCHGGPAD